MLRHAWHSFVCALACTVLLSTATSAQTLISSGLTDEQKQLLVDLHNNHRRQLAQGMVVDDGTNGTYPTASNMSAVVWDDALAAVAQGHAAQCLWGHNSDRNTQIYTFSDLFNDEVYGQPLPQSGFYMGENVAGAWSSQTPNIESVLTNQVNGWWSEQDLWHFQTYNPSTINGAGHFTQVGWADTRQIGCGFAVCDDGMFAGLNLHFLVCDYYTGGNYLGQYPYETGTCSAATCGADQTCIDDLCVWNGVPDTDAGVPDAGVPDAGMAMDSGVSIDAGQTPDDDAGQTPDDDAGQTPDDDAGQTPDDDAGQTPDDDAGQAPDDDAGQTPDDDAGQNNDDDAGPSEPDPSPEDDVEANCSCDASDRQAAPAAGWALVVLLGAALRRRRQTRSERS